MSRPLRALAQRGLVRNTGTLFLGQGGKVLLQGAYFAVIARALGVEAFGGFSAIVALVALVAPFASLGAMNLMVRHIVNDPGSESRQFATALVVSVLGACAMTGLLAAIGGLVAPPSLPLWVLAAVAAADLLGARVVDLAGGVWVAREQMARTAGYQLELNGARLAGAIVLWLFPGAFNLESWTLVYLGVSLAISATVIVRVWVRFGWALPDWAQYGRDWREGLLFAVGLSSQSVYNDIDKAMLGRLSTLEATGIYTAAYRVVDMAYTPVRSLLGAAYPRFFREGAKGLRSALNVARTIAKPGVGYCMAVFVLLIATADLVPVILGSDYQPAVAAIRALSIIPLIRIVHYLAADALTGSGHQGWRSAVQVGIALTNVGLNFWLIPAFGYWGAVIASLLSDGLLAVLLWIVVAVILKRRKASAGVAPTN